MSRKDLENIASKTHNGNIFGTKSGTTITEKQSYIRDCTRGERERLCQRGATTALEIEFSKTYPITIYFTFILVIQTKKNIFSVS